MKIEFSKEEAKAAIELVDLAVKTGGLGVAQAGVAIANKLHVALQAKPEEKPKEEATK